MRTLTIPMCMWWIGVFGCVAPAEEPTLGEVEQAICTQIECTGNSPVIAGIGFHELNELGVANLEGFAVVDLWKNNQSYRLDVARGEIIGRSANGNLQGAAVQGARIRLTHTNPNTNAVTPHVIRITTFQWVQSFAKLNNSTRPIPTYEFDLGLNGPNPTQFRPLCNKVLSDHSPDLLGIPKTLSVVFEGERINAATKTIAANLDPNWFTIGCPGSMPAKGQTTFNTNAMHLRYGSSTSIAQLQAFTKMVVGDYCGNGVSLTVAGQLLEWEDAHVPRYTEYKSAPADLEVEARWTASGATCLNVPRIDANHTQLGDTTFNNSVIDEISATCPALLNTDCGADLNALAGAHFISANPT